jgi:sec-independent protein translocase protein TatB
MNFLGMGPMELLLIVVIALIVFGPARLPEIMAQVGKAIGDFRRATSELSNEFNRTIQAELQETRAVVDDAKATLLDAKASVYDAHASVNSAITGMPAPALTAVPGASEVAPAATNGTSAAYAEAPTNGTAPASSLPSSPATPALADTTQWSWETAPSAASLAPAPATSTVETPAPPAASPAPTAPQATNPALPATERAARDDLLPPY